MKIEKIKEAAKLVEKLEKAYAVLAKIKVADEKAIGNEYWSSISEHGDGSGWNVNLNGIIESPKVIDAVRKLVEEEIDSLSHQIDAI